MATFMVVARFREGTDMSEVFEVVAEEQAAAKALQEAGRIASIHLALERGTVFLEVSAGDQDEAVATVEELPMARWWELDAYATSVPGAPS